MEIILLAAPGIISSYFDNSDDGGIGPV